MNGPAVPPVKLGDSERRLKATAANQACAEELLSKFAYLLDHTSLAPTSTSLPKVAQLFEHVPGPATPSGEAIQPLNNVPLSSSNETHDNPMAAVHAGPLLTGDVQPHEPSRHFAGWKPKALALASFVVIGTAVALGSRDYVLGHAEIYESMLLDAIAGLDDAPNPRGNVGNVMHDESMAQGPSDETIAASAAPSTAGPPPIADRPRSARATVESSREQAVDASAPAAPVRAPAPAAGAPADVGATRTTPLASGPARAPKDAGPPLLPDSTQPARVGVDEQAADASAPPPPVSTPAPAASASADVGATQSRVGVSDATQVAKTRETPLASGPAPAPGEAGPPLMPDSTQPARVGVDKQAVDASAPAAPVSAPEPANAPADVGATRSGVGVSSATPVATAIDTPTASVRAATQLPLGSQIREPKPVGTVSAPDWTPTSSTTDSIETSNGGDALKLSAKPASVANMGSAGTAKVLNPSSDLREIPGGKPSAGLAATPKIAAETPSRPPKSAKRQKREKSEKSATAPKLNAAEAAASSLPATSEEPPAPDQGPTNPLQGVHAGRL